MPTIELIIFLLIVAAGLEVLSRRINVPRPILLVLAGTLLALVPAAPSVRVNPDLIFFIFLPPLLYWPSINTSYREFRRNGLEIMLLAVGLVIATAAAVAAAAHLVCPTLTWPAAFALGAAVGPTDAVAATSVMRRFGVPRSIVSVLEGESLVNDATSLVIFEMAITASNTGQFALGPALLRFLWAAGGGVIIGISAGWCIAQLRRWLGTKRERTSVVESSVSLLTPYVAFITADRIGTSGVLAVVAVGLYLGREAPKLLSAVSRIQVTDMWDVLDFLLEGLLFIFVGLGIPLALGAVSARGETTTLNLILTSALVSAIVVVLRLAWVFPATYGPYYLRRRFHASSESSPPWRGVFFEGWAGLRGAVSLVLALSIPFTTASGTPFPGRDLIIFLTFVVILVTLVGQGLTLGPLIQRLELEPDRAEEYEEAAARLQTARAGLARLDDIAAGTIESAANTGAPSSVTPEALREVETQLRDRYSHLVHRFTAKARRHTGAKTDDAQSAEDQEADGIEASADANRAAAHHWLRLAMIDAERRELIRLRDTNKIGDDTLHRIEHGLDLEQMLLSRRDR